MARPLPPSDRLPPFERLVELMRILRADCPWDREQTLQSLKSFAVEETYEVLDAIDRGDPLAHREELGDLLLQIVFQAQLRAEEGAFDAADVCRAITEKLIRRHPHVFEDVSADDADQAYASWRRIKEEERARKGRTSALDGVPRALPALLRATRLADKASAVGFDWGGPSEVGPVVRDEVEELIEAASGGDLAHVRHEIGDLLFALANLARHLGLDPEEALAAADDRFERRFRRVEELAEARGDRLPDLDPAGLDALWREAKQDLADTRD